MQQDKPELKIIDRSIARMKSHVIDGDKIDWAQWMKPSECARIIPAETLAEEVKRSMFVPQVQQGLVLPWAKTNSKVLLQSGKLAVWTGWSHHGKSLMLKQIMLHAIENSERVLIASMEEDVRDIFRDMAEMFCDGDPTPRGVDEFLKLISGKLWLYDQSGVVDANRMLAVIYYAAEKFKITQAVIDSLMMLAVSRDDYDAQSKFVGALKSCAKDTQATIHLVAHMRKREGVIGDSKPGSPHDIAGGHEIASKADYIFNVWRDKKPESTQCLLGVEKQRGRINFIGKFSLQYDPKKRKFVDTIVSQVETKGTYHDEF